MIEIREAAIRIIHELTTAPETTEKYFMSVLEM
jgi:hypothetical protein